MYGFKEISYEGIENGYQKYSETVGGVDIGQYPDIVTYNFKPAQWKFSFEILISSLEDYLYERDSTKVFYYCFTPQVQKELQYGMAYYKTLKALLRENNPDMRAFHILYEHKKMMNLRLKYLRKEFGYINDEVSLAYKFFEESTLLARNIILKNDIQGISNLISKLNAIIDKVEHNEREILPTFIKDLKSFKEKKLLI